jgi:tetratricopeptide (TPR) repeat protein/SAM-dependent methyltransferase
MNRKERRAANKRTQGGPGGPPVTALFDQAVRLHQAGQVGEAEALGREIATRDPKHVGNLHLLAMIAHQSGRFEAAATLFRKVVALRPEIAIVHHGLGAALAGAGRMEEAAAAFEQALALSPPGPDGAVAHLHLGNLYNQVGRLADAARCYERVLALQPDHAEARNSLGAVLVAQGRLAEGSAELARALMLAPELFEGFSGVAAALRRAVPALDEAVRRAVAAWPRRLPASELFAPGSLAAIADDPMFRCVLHSSTIRDLDLEKFLTTLRAALLDSVSEAAGDDAATSRLAAAIARQCFVNEYVFLDTPDELMRVDALKRTVLDQLDSGAPIAPLQLAVLASYASLSTLPNVQRFLDRSWPADIAGLLTQQIVEPEQERASRDAIPKLTEVGGGASSRVRQQYEENPYPRWVLAPSQRTPVSVDEYLRSQFPGAHVQPVSSGGTVEILIAGCGTGEHPIGMARRFRGAHVVAVDLSLSSLAYAARKTRELGLHGVEYAQADILELGSLGRTFDIVDSSGVLHHLAEPLVGWRELVALVRPSGLMRVGLYSERARADIVDARAFIAARRFGSSADDIRRCRHELLATSHGSLARYRDFFSISECRDLLFHVQEQRLTIPKIREFLDAQRLRFLGFELDAATLQAYRDQFPHDPAMTSLDCWDAFELRQPGTFRAMYQFWCQRL